MDSPFTIAAAFGVGVGVLAVVVHHIQAKNEQVRLERQLQDLRREIIELKREISHLTREQNADDKPNGNLASERRRHVKRRVREIQREFSERSGYDTDGTSTMYSAADTDDDDVFFDISSDDEGDQLTNRSFHFNNIDRLLEGTYEEKKTALNLALERSKTTPQDANLLWRIARAYKYQVDEAAERGDTQKVQENIDLGLSHALNAIEVDPTIGEAQMWCAILLGMKTDFLPLTERVQNGLRFQKHLQLALERLPENRVLHHLLARYKFAIASLSWLERRAAKMLGELPDFTMDDVLVDAKKAEELSDEPWPENKLLIAKAFLAIGGVDDGLHWLKDAKQFSAETKNFTVEKEVDELLMKYGNHR